MKTKADFFEDAIIQFGVESALEYFDVPEKKKNFFRKELSPPDWKAALAWELRYDNYEDLNTDTQFVAEWMAKKLSGK